jgi:hypothetical protein
MPAVSSQVARVVIGAHSRCIEEKLFSLFGRNKWALEFETACRNVIIDGIPRLHSDGVQVWKNTRLL